MQEQQPRGPEDGASWSSSKDLALQEAGGSLARPEEPQGHEHELHGQTGRLAVEVEAHRGNRVDMVVDRLTELADEIEAADEGERSVLLHTTAVEEKARVSAELAVPDRTSDELGDYVGALARLDNAAGGELAMWQALESVPGENLDKMPPGANEALLAIGAKTEVVTEGDQYQNFLQVAERVHSEDNGAMISWRQGEIVKAPEYLTSLVKSERFVPACIDIAAEQAEKNTDHEVRDQHLEKFTRQALEGALALPEEEGTGLSFAFRSSLARRTMADDYDGTPLRYNRGGGMQVIRWSEVLKHFVANVMMVGTDTAVRMHREFGVTNFDQYSPGELGVFEGLLAGDEDIIDRFKQGYVVHDSDIYTVRSGGKRTRVVYRQAEEDLGRQPDEHQNVIRCEAERLDQTSAHVANVTEAIGQAPRQLEIEAGSGPMAAELAAGGQPAEQKTAAEIEPPKPNVIRLVPDENGVFVRQTEGGAGRSSNGEANHREAA